MKVRNFYIVIGLTSVLYFPVYASKMISDEEDISQTPNCRTIFKEMVKTEENLKKLQAKNGQIPIGVINTYQDYQNSLLQLYQRAKNDENMNVQEELYIASQKAF